MDLWTFTRTMRVRVSRHRPPDRCWRKSGPQMDGVDLWDFISKYCELSRIELHMLAEISTTGTNRTFSSQCVVCTKIQFGGYFCSLLVEKLSESEFKGTVPNISCF